MKIGSIKQGEKTDKQHIVSWKRVLLNVTFLGMLLSGFIYYQATNIVIAKPLRINRMIEPNRQIEDETLYEKLDEEMQIAEAISTYNHSLEEEDIASLARIIQEASERYNYDWRLILAIIKVESQFDARAESSKGARGLMQVLPSTAEWLSPKLGIEYSGHDSLYDPQFNIKLGTHYLYMMHQKFGDIKKAVVAYNRGPRGLLRYLSQGRDFPPVYLARVMSYYKELKSRMGLQANINS